MDIARYLRKRDLIIFSRLKKHDNLETTIQTTKNPAI